MRYIFTAFAALSLAACSTAQETAETDATAATPVSQVPQQCVGEAYRQFDFWIGTWEVADTQGNPQGRNVISSAENDCLLIERWTSASGSTGQSYNFYDPVTRKWNQVWVSLGAVINYAGGLTDAGAMKLVGTIHYRNGTSFPFTGEWALQDDGTVRQHFEQYDPEAKIWNPWFTGIYTKVDEAD